MNHPQTQQAQQGAIVARGLTKIYKGSRQEPDKLALDAIDLTVPHGSIFGLLGPNGAGKSTFINILAGLVVKTAGRAEIWGFDIDKNPRQSRASIGVVPQELNIDPFFTPFEILDIQAGLYAVPRNERRTMEILNVLGLGDRRDTYVRTLSGGMRRRLLVAKAMVHYPPVLVLDEPTAGVDIELRKQLWDYVRELNAAGTTVVLTTHYLEEAQEMCDRIAIINHGEVVACDTKTALLERIDEKTLVITPQNELNQVPEVIRARCAFSEIRPDGKMAVSCNRARDNVDQILGMIHEAGIIIKDLSTEESDLEDIFLQLTRSETARPRS